MSKIVGPHGGVRQDFDVLQEMKLFIALLYILISPAIAQLGRDAVFEHQDPRFKSFQFKKAHAVVTGRADGLMIQVPKQSVAKFITKDCVVILPNGQKKKLHFTQMGEGLKGFWTAKFNLATGARPVGGLYRYSLSVEIDGKVFGFSHALKYSFEKMDGLGGRTKQVGPIN